jgi:hypothetical protein
MPDKAGQGMMPANGNRFSAKIVRHHPARTLAKLNWQNLMSKPHGKTSEVGGEEPVRRMLMR